MFIKVTDALGRQHVVNLEYVTAIESPRYMDKTITTKELWVVGHAGYKTFSILINEDEAVRICDIISERGLNLDNLTFDKQHK